MARQTNMKAQKAKINFKRQQGIVLIISMIFIAIFSVLAVSMATMSGTNTQLASNQHKVNSAYAATQSGLECGKYIISTINLQETGYNYVTEDEVEQVWLDLHQHIENTALDSKTVPPSSRFTDSGGNGDEIIIPAIDYGDTNTEFTVRFYRYDDDPHTITLQATGTYGEITKQINLNVEITKDSSLLNYAVASRGRMWLTGDTTIHGDVFNSWDRPETAPFNMTSDTTVLGTVNTVLTLDQIKNEYYQLETLDEDDNPIFDEDGNRIYSPQDEIQAYHEGINYDQTQNDIPGMNVDDYDTDCYNNGLADIPPRPEESREVEYFPHAAGNYNYPRDGSPSNTWDRRLERHVYENQTFTNARLPDDRNALFRNCTFENILYIDCNKSSKYHYNNVRFDDCTFNGPIITDVPQALKWKENCLYFTGEAAFDNQSDIQEATILAPQFNVNIGNTNSQQTDYNVLTGAIVGGIVDVRGNAQIHGTIISMCDTTQWSSGYVTNIGATLDDGGSETTELGDIGVISITPREEQMLPSGITSPIVLKPLTQTYSES